MAIQLNQAIGKVHKVEEVPVENYNWYTYNKPGSQQRIDAVDNLIDPGLISIRSRVKVSFDLLK